MVIQKVLVKLADENIDQSGMFGAPKPSARGFGLDLGVVYEWATRI